jgi:hypothetical protein
MGRADRRHGAVGTQAIGVGGHVEPRELVDPAAETSTRWRLLDRGGAYEFRPSDWLLVSNLAQWIP